MTRQIQAQKDAGVRRPVFKVFSAPPGTEGQGHPVFTNDQNVMVRGVHDAIAHYAGGHPFSARGEYGAYNRHLKTLCNRDQVNAGECMAAKALFTEVVAQTSCYYVYGNYVDQKVGILYDFDHAQIGKLASNSPLNEFFVVSQKRLICKPDFQWDKFAHRFPKLATELKRQEKLNSSKVPLEEFKGVR